MISHLILRLKIVHISFNWFLHKNDNIIETNRFNEEMIIDNIKKLSLKINDDKNLNSKTIDYSASYIN